MTTLRSMLAVLVAKGLAVFLTTFTKNGATAAPGYYALKIDPHLVYELSKHLKRGTIVVAGTNGKTTTARMIAAIFQRKNISYIHNKEGSNLLRGFASVLAQKATWGGGVIADYALWEVDEATLPQLLHQVTPKIIVLTNLFRDQLDRYGEVASVRSKWQTVLGQLDKDTTVILNADDPSIASLGSNTKANVLYYGLDYASQTKTVATSADANFCPVCNTELAYDKIYFSHIGIFSCPNCGFTRPKPTAKGHTIETTPDQTSMTITPQEGESITLTIPLPGTYNMYNALAATSVALVLKLNKIAEALTNFKSAFGRVETISIGNKILKLFLVKNPTGFNEVLHTLLQGDQHYDQIAMALNDNFADGTDVSWIWDVNFEQLQHKVKTVKVTGIRRYDLALRLKYAQVDQRVEESLESIVDQFVSDSTQQTLYYLPSYTAMLELRQYLVKKGYVKHYLD